MKYLTALILIIFLLLSLSGDAQDPSQKPTKMSNYLYSVPNYMTVGSGLSISKRDTTEFKPTIDGTINVHTDNALYIWMVDKWIAVAAGAGDLIDGGPFTTSNVEIGFDPGTNLTPKQLIEKVWYGLKPPTASLSGGTTMEYDDDATLPFTLNWSAGRQSNTDPITSIVVAGVSQSFLQPAQGASVNGTQAVNVPTNTSTTYQNVVTTDDGQTATASTTFNSLPRKYYGWISDTTGIASGAQDADILALTSTLSSSRTLGIPTPYDTGDPDGTQFFCYVYLASLGATTSVTFNGLPAIEAMNIITKSFTTATGFTGTYYIIYNKQGQNLSSQVIFQ